MPPFSFNLSTVEREEGGRALVFFCGACTQSGVGSAQTEDRSVEDASLGKASKAETEDERGKECLGTRPGRSCECTYPCATRSMTVVAPPYLPSMTPTPRAYILVVVMHLASCVEVECARYLCDLCNWTKEGLCMRTHTHTPCSTPMSLHIAQLTRLSFPGAVRVRPPPLGEPGHSLIPIAR